MKLLGKILLATDFGDAAAAATKSAVALATTFGSEIVPLHVLRDMRGLIGLQTMEGVRESVDRKLQDLSRRLTEKNVAVEPPIVAHGLPFQQILNHANARNANVIFLGDGERGAKRELQSASHAQGI